MPRRMLACASGFSILPSVRTRMASGFGAAGSCAESGREEEAEGERPTSNVQLPTFNADSAAAAAHAALFVER